MALDQDYSEILCIGLKQVGKPGKIVSLPDLFNTLLSDEFWTLVTFNGKQFDIPIILKQAIKQGLITEQRALYRGLFSATQKFNTRNHYDLMQYIPFFGQAKSLDKYSQIYLGKSKTECDFNTASKSEIEAHCLEDLDITESLFNMFSPMFM